MHLLILGREPHVVRRGVETILSQGIPATGVSDDATAISALTSGTITDLLIGGGVEADARATLKRVAAEHNVTVLESTRRGRDVADYLVDDVIPQLRARQ
ncbi:hypothetical protein [Nocardia blacklockiae]|uniref:hypothetical protein n=1 Tax=Nocardia blacklockiae TaxID=480036 RepID=UPI0018959A73|nr:hypothetical protein [Nocardia blacklockiae]MBF6175494.1 hypothetical protein [Nocardia blacklockiae]